MKIKKTLQQWKEYSKMSDLGEIARRKFFNNCFDGALTCAGIVSGVFIIFLFKEAGSSIFAPKDVLITGFATALAIGIRTPPGSLLDKYSSQQLQSIRMIVFSVSTRTSTGMCLFDPRLRVNSPSCFMV